MNIDIIEVNSSTDIDLILPFCKLANKDYEICCGF